MLSDKIPLPNLAATKSLAKTIAPILHKGDLLALSGDLGTGKTEFARALLYALGAKCDIPSPTFTLLQTYEIGDLLVSHFDLYRLKSAAELDELGWEDTLADGITLVEWPERASGRLLSSRLTLHFSLDADGSRSCHVEKSGEWRDRLKKLF